HPILARLEQTQAARAAQGWRVQRDGVTAERTLNDPGTRVVVGGLVAGELFGRLLQALFLQPGQIERKRRLEDFLQEQDETLGAGLGAGQTGQGLLQLAHRADAHLVPVEEALLKVAIGGVGLLAGGVLAAERVEELFQDRSGFRLGFQNLLGRMKEMGQQTLFVNGGRHRITGHSVKNLASKGLGGPASGHAPAGPSSAAPSAELGWSSASSSDASSEAEGGRPRASLIRRVISMLFFTP